MADGRINDDETTDEPGLLGQSLRHSAGPQP
jgi:hypothetical protein